MAAVSPDAQLRQIPLGKTILLSIVTLSVYFWIQTWRNSQDIQGARDDGFSWWKIMFVLGFFTFGVTFIVLWVINFLQVHKIRTEMGADDTLGIVALVLTFVTAVVGPIVWNIHWNNTVDQLTGTTSTAVAAAANAA